jgi:hypothetical protein
VNTGLQPIGFGADFSLPDQRGEFNELLEIETTWDFDCSQSDMNCAIDLKCGSNRKNCNPSWNCPSCKWYQADCHVRKAGCEADKVRFRLQCNVENEATKAVCDARQIAERGACEVVKAAKKAGCELNKTWLKSVNGADIGRLTGSYSLTNTTAKVYLHGAVVTDGLDKITLDTTLGADSTVQFGADFQPYDFGYLACQAPVNLNLNTGIGLKPQRFSLVANKVGDEITTDGLSLSYRTEKQLITIATELPPMLKLTLLNPDFVFKCLPVAELVTVGALFKRVREDLLRTNYDYEVNPFEIEMRVPGFDVPVFDGNIRYRPVESTIGLWFQGTEAPRTEVRISMLREDGL